MNTTTKTNTRTPRALSLWHVEMTDTFAGEANYSWVRRATLRIPADASAREVVRRVKAWADLTGTRGETTQTGDGYVIRPRGACVVVFATYAHTLGGTVEVTGRGGAIRWTCERATGDVLRVDVDSEDADGAAYAARVRSFDFEDYAEWLATYDGVAPSSFVDVSSINWLALAHVDADGVRVPAENDFRLDMLHDWLCDSSRVDMRGTWSLDVSNVDQLSRAAAVAHAFAAAHPLHNLDGVDALEVAACVDDGDTTERCDSARAAYAWLSSASDARGMVSVYWHRPHTDGDDDRGGAECFADFALRDIDTARTFARRMAARLGVPVHDFT